jgi:hypothetical protein
MIADTRSSWGYSVGRRSRRRGIVIAYWIAMCLALLGFARHSIRHSGVFVSPALVNILVFLPAVLGGVRAGGAVKPFRGVRFAPLDGGEGTLTLFRKAQSGRGINPSDGEMDERETRDRDRVHFTAYTVGRWMAMGLFLVCGAVDAWRPELLVWLAPGFLFLLVLMLWSLPQSLILWNEPDVEEAR